jgi:hypothetical protein
MLSLEQYLCQPAISERQAFRYVKSMTLPETEAESRTICGEAL